MSEPRLRIAYEFVDKWMRRACDAEAKNRAYQEILDKRKKIIADHLAQMDAQRLENAKTLNALWEECGQIGHLWGRDEQDRPQCVICHKWD